MTLSEIVVANRNSFGFDNEIDELLIMIDTFRQVLIAMSDLFQLLVADSRRESWQDTKYRQLLSMKLCIESKRPPAFFFNDYDWVLTTCANTRPTLFLS